MTQQAVIYCRFSPRRDERTSQSNATQRDACRAFCETRGHSVVGEFCDKAAEGDDPERPGLWDAIAALPKGGVLVVTEMHRLARCPILEDTIVRSVRRAKASIEPVDGRPVSHDESPSDELVRRILASVHAYQKKAGAALTSARMRAQQAAGICVGGVPYGKRREGDKLVDDDYEQDVIRAIRQHHSCGIRRMEIPPLLNRAGYSNRGKPWDRSAVYRVLKRLERETAGV